MIFLEIFQNVEQMNEMSQDLPLSCRHEPDIQEKKDERKNQSSFWWDFLLENKFYT